MATKPKAKKAGKNHQSVELLNKLKFVAQVQKKDHDYTSHCVIKNRMIYATDNVFTIGVRIDEDIEACPHTHSLINALSKCGEQVSIAIDKKGLAIQSGKLNVKIATLNPEMMPPIEPDPPIQGAIISDVLKEGFATVGVLAKEGELLLYKATLLLQAYFVTASNGNAAMQYRHGIDLPPDLVIPKKFADLVVKNPAGLLGFGWTRNRSVTFWFDDGSFIKTQLQRGEWPDVEPILGKGFNPQPLPEGFAEAIAAVVSFGPNSLIEFGDGVVTSDIDGTNLASYEVEGLPQGRIFNGKLLSAMTPFIESADFNTYDDRVMFYGCGGNMRGALSANKKA